MLLKGSWRFFILCFLRCIYIVTQVGKTFKFKYFLIFSRPFFILWLVCFTFKSVHLGSVSRPLLWLTACMLTVATFTTNTASLFGCVWHQHTNINTQSQKPNDKSFYHLKKANKWNATLFLASVYKHRNIFKQRIVP